MHDLRQQRDSRTARSWRLRAAGRRRRRWQRCLPAALLLLASLGAGGPAAAAQGGTPDVARLADRTTPTLRFVTNEILFSISLPDPVFNQNEMGAFIGSRIQRGLIRSEKQAVAAALAELARNPSKYWRPARTNVTEKGRIFGTGPGLVVHPDGYVVANAHLVKPSDEALTAYIRSQMFEVYYDEMLADLREEVGEGLDERQSKQFLDSITSWAGDHLKVADVEMRYTVATPTRSASGSDETKERTAELVAAGERLPAEDVAVLKVEDSKNLITAPFALDDQLAPGDSLFAMSVPTTTTFTAVEVDDPKPPLRAARPISGKFQAAKTGDSGTLVQTDIKMSDADTGGPVFDDAGRVVGLTSFSAIDPKTGREDRKQSSVVPASGIRDMLARVNVQPVESPATQKLNQALEVYGKRWYKDALPLLQEVDALDPGHPFVQRHIQESRAAIAAGKDETPVRILGLPLVLVIGLAVLALLLVAGLVTLLVMRSARRRRRARAAVPAGGPPLQPGGPYPPPGGYYPGHATTAPVWPDETQADAYPPRAYPPRPPATKPVPTEPAGPPDDPWAPYPGTRTWPVAPPPRGGDDPGPDERRTGGAPSQVPDQRFRRREWPPPTDLFG